MIWFRLNTSSVESFIHYDEFKNSTTSTARYGPKQLIEELHDLFQSDPLCTPTDISVTLVRPSAFTQSKSLPLTNAGDYAGATRQYINHNSTLLMTKLDFFN